MPSWNESEYVKRANEIASQHVISKKSLDELCEKVARDENMNPNEIRTLVRLANVATFQELFKRKDDGDKMVEFDTGDPEKVINNIVSEAGQEPQSANIYNDKLSSEIPDLMREVRRGPVTYPVKLAAQTTHHWIVYPEGQKDTEEYRKSVADTLRDNKHFHDWVGKSKKGEHYKLPHGGFVVHDEEYVHEDKPEKKASDDEFTKPGRTDLVILNLQKLAEEFEIERRIAGSQWERAVEKLASEYRKLSSSVRQEFMDEFEKDAFATYGTDIVPELTYMCSLTRQILAVPAMEKVAQLKDRRLVEDNEYLGMLKTAYEARQHYQKFENGLAWIKANTPKLGV